MAVSRIIGTGTGFHIPAFRIDEIQPVGGPGRTVCCVFAGALLVVGDSGKNASLFQANGVERFSGGAKIPIHFILPRVLPKMDRWLGAKVVCSGYLVTATRMGKVSPCYDLAFSQHNPVDSAICVEP